MNALQDDKGNWSSLRILLLMLFLFVLFLYYDWRHALYYELNSEIPNYEGITLLFNAMIGGFITLVAALILKIVQKFIEKKKDESGTLINKPKKLKYVGEDFNK